MQRQYDCKKVHWLPTVMCEIWDSWLLNASRDLEKKMATKCKIHGLLIT